MYSKNIAIIEYNRKFLQLKYNSSRSDPINMANALDVISKITRQFKFIVNDKIYYVNKDIARQLCSKILNAQKGQQNNNNEVLSFDVNIKDNDNKMQMFVDICNGKIVAINQKKDRDFFFSLSQILGFNLPSICTIPNSILSRRTSKMIQLSLSPAGAVYFLKNVSDNFEIKTQNEKYHFPYTLAPLSNLISKLLEEDPKIREYDYLIDNNSEFKIIEKFLNGCKINIIPQNIEYVSQFAHDLEIPILLEKIDNFSKEFEYSQQVLDEEFDQDSNLADLQDLLFNLNDQNLQLAISKIDNSVWTSSFELKKELISNIAVVASYRHSHLHNLVKICQHLSENDPRFLEFLTNYVLKVANDSILLCQFVYFLSRENLIPIKDVLKFISFQYTETTTSKAYYSMLIFFFLPELLDEYPFIFELISPRLKGFFIPNMTNPTTYDYTDYLKSREKMQNLDPMAISISSDDPDLLQKQVMQNSFNVKRVLGRCQFDNIEELTLVNYAALHGSVNCFKYLVINSAEITQTTFVNSVIGGNTEIIRIIEQKLSSEPELHTQNNNNNNNNFIPTFRHVTGSRLAYTVSEFPGRAFKGKKNLRPGLEDSENENDEFSNNFNNYAFGYSSYKKFHDTAAKVKTTGLATPIMTNQIKTNIKDYLLYAACSYHHNGILEWIIQQTQNQSEMIEYLRYCFHATTETNNINALALIIDSGVTLNSPQNYLANILLTTAALYGFSDVFRIILNSAGNDAIFDSCSGRATTLIAASQFGSMKIVEMIIKSGAKLAQEDIRSAIHESIDQHNFDVFFRLIEVFDFDISNDFFYLLFIAAASGSIEIIEFLFANYPEKLDCVFNPNDESNINIDGICSTAARNDQYESIQLIYNFLVQRQSQLLLNDNDDDDS